MRRFYLQLALMALSLILSACGVNWANIFDIN
jgi:outer membrane lipopolysaccharide assembly protein LptE/RlpB